ncbi:MAG: hypothetical protein COA97_03960 [Flavobacteriales bacterium]|nr:MAG: hypothetical protein COA97_03960 [Flavobacteriales bacterium]
MKFLQFIIFIFLIVISFFAKGQEYLTMDKEQIKYMFEDWQDSLTITDNQDVLIISSEGFDKFTDNYFFNESGKCDSSYIRHYCNECVQGHIDRILKYKKEKWVEVLPNTYLSDKRISWTIGFSRNKESECKKMTIIKTPSKDVCATISFSIVTMKSSEWKKKIKSKQ